MKRLFDFAVSGLVLIALAPLFLAIALLIKLDSAGPILFRQRRIGRNFQPFSILKFRTMKVRSAAAEDFEFSAENVTSIGNWLRSRKMDELPQLWNVFLGEMSLVGPRPELEKYVKMFRSDYEVLLHVRPGVTDPASLAYRNEGELLRRAADPEAEYVNSILPHKIKLSEEYLQRQTILGDISLIFRSAQTLIR